MDCPVCHIGLVLLGSYSYLTWYHYNDCQMDFGIIRQKCQCENPNLNKKLGEEI